MNGNEKTGRKPDWHMLAILSELLALSFRSPGRVLAEALSTGEYQDSVFEITVLADLNLSSETLNMLSQYIGKDLDDLIRALKKESAFLFVDTPDLVASPYETVWRSSEDGVDPLLYVSPYAMNVERFMKSCGIVSADSSKGPVDSISTELEFLEYLAGMSAGIIERPSTVRSPEGSWELSYRRFMQEHAILWMPHFADAVIRETREPFFGAAAELVKGLCCYDLRQVDAM